MGRNWWIVRVLLCAASWVGTVGACRLLAQDASTPLTMPGDPESQIELALTQPLKTPLDYIDMPLRDIMQVMSDEYKIPVQFDDAAMEQVAMSPDTEVSLTISNVSLRAALELMFKRIPDLTFVIEHEVLLITTQEEANIRHEVRVYRIDDLLGTHPGDALFANEAEYEVLIELIVNNVAAGTWDSPSEGEALAFSPGMLVVSATFRVHEQIESLLENLREARTEVLAAAGLQDDSRMVTLGIKIDPEAAKTQAEQDAIRTALMQSVDWQADREENENVFLTVLPARVLVRHKASIVREVQRSVRGMALEPAPVPKKPAGGFGGRAAAQQEPTGAGRRGGF
jgi:hypothetical protein